MGDFDAIVIGAGIVGLASAARLARDGRSVLVLERHGRPGQETTSRNSGVIHAGLYYGPGSLKARLCVEGRRLLYERCHRHGIGHRRTGKLVVATNAAEVDQLEALLERARENDSGATRLLGKGEVRQLEPSVAAEAALWSPESGIVDVHELLYSYQREAVEHGATLSFRSQVTGLRRDSDDWSVEALSAGETCTLQARCVVNAAGLFADRLAAWAGLDIDALGYRQLLCKGDYFALDDRLSGLVRHLVYPVPAGAGLGIHITFDLGGRLTLGPDTEYVSTLSYAVDDAKRAHFARAARRYLPGIEAAALRADYAGVRPKLQRPGEPPRDFLLVDAAEHGEPGLICLLGIESPGITASAALANRVASLCDPYF